MTESELKKLIRDIPDFPKPGILFRDLTPLLADKTALPAAIDALAEPFKNLPIDAVAAVEARGFIFGSAVAKTLSAGFVPIRKKGKLPWKTTQIQYELEYGSDVLEVHSDAVGKHSRVLMVDDVLATGGTMRAACELVQKLGATIVGISVLVELSQLGGRKKLQDWPVHSVIIY